MADLKKILALFSGNKIAIIGDLMLDSYWEGEITRISPEAPVPVVKIERKRHVPGGAANVAANIASLGGKAALIGVVGEDEAGKTLRQLLTAANIQTGGVIVDAARQTTCKTRIVASNHHLLRADEEDDRPVSKNIEESMFKSLESALVGAKALIISDYNKGAITKALSKRLIKTAKARGIPVLIDSKNYLEYGMKNATLLKPNLGELSKETGMPVGSASEIERAAKHFYSRLMPGALFITMGEKGMLLLDKKTQKIIEGIRIKAVDVSGAGDTVISTAALALAAGAGMEDAAKLANYAAAVVVGKVGTATPSREEISKLIPI